MYLQISNTSVVSISLPTIGKELNIAESKLQWLASAFALSSVRTHRRPGRSESHFCPADGVSLRTPRDVSYSSSAAPRTCTGASAPSSWAA